MTPPGHSEAIKALAKAKDALHNAEYDLKGGFILATANRSYYACYYCMTALLYTKDVYAKTHQGTRAKFSELFIKTGIFPLAVSDSLALLFDSRQEADYDLDVDIKVEEAKNLIEKAKDFV
ncbi:MAG: hypothetical protein JWQ30_1206 [Sediminibacterium sp.]|nr:hypothetical protein [Sediminibacterium sp.]